MIKNNKEKARGDIMNSVIRIASSVYSVSPALPEKNVSCAIDAAAQAAKLGADLIVFPTLSLTGASVGDLLLNRSLLSAADEALKKLIRETAHYNCYVIAGLPAAPAGQAVSAMAVFYRGRLLDLIPDLNPPTSLAGNFGNSFCEGENAGFADPYTVYNCGDLHFSVLPCDPARLAFWAPEAIRHGADLLIVPSSVPSRAGTLNELRRSVRGLSASLCCAIALVNGGPGEGTAPAVYEGFTALYECGREIAFERGLTEPLLSCNDIDADIVYAHKRTLPLKHSAFGIGSHTPRNKTVLLRRVEKNPYLPADFSEAENFLSELFLLQVHSLAARMRHIGTKKLVLGVSGGIDSTLALLVCAKALDSLGLPRHNLIGITMPGFGTTGRTYENAVRLIEESGAELREIPIGDSVLQHFKDIEQNPEIHDVTYENSQARERTQILFDLSNKENALVVGTGDLSEISLGWCTFGGDHFASFGVNSSVTKTMARLLLTRLSNSEGFSSLRPFISDVLKTPVSPELLPPDTNGSILQKTEEVLGPYELHEFFLYYFVRYGMAPSKIFQYALNAFDGEYQPEQIKKALQVFLKRFVSSQFKRSCAPESAALGPVSLLSTDFSFASDLSSEALLRELEQAEIFY